MAALIKGVVRAAHVWPLLICVFVYVFLVACGGHHTSTVNKSHIVSLAVVPSDSKVALGQTSQFKAMGRFSDGSSQDVTQIVNWATSNNKVASVGNSGLATSIAVGTATVNATSGGLLSSGTLVVSPPSIESVTIRPAELPIALGTTGQLKATGKFTDASEQDVTAQVTWESALPGIVAVNPTGVATAVSIGKTTVTASSGASRASCEVTVLPLALAAITIVEDGSTMPLGTTLKLVAKGSYTDGSASDLTNAVSWTSASPGIVSISAAGDAAANGLGTTSISAKSGGFTGLASLTVVPAALTSITIQPSKPVVPLGGSLQLGATGLFTDKSTKDLATAVKWSIVDDGIATITETGGVTGQQVGTTTVSAIMNGVETSANLVVQPLAFANYFTAPPDGSDATIRMTNPGGTGGDLCALLYIFDHNQSMIECCGCAIVPDGLRILSLRKDLISNPLTGSPSVAGSLLMVTADRSKNSACNASSITPAGTGVAWETHMQMISAGTVAVSETEFSSMHLNDALSAALQAQCLSIRELGSGRGTCTCGSGD